MLYAFVSQRRVIVMAMKNPMHPNVIRFLDGNDKNLASSNMEVVNVFDALHHGYVTNADEFYSARELKDMKEDVANSVAVADTVLECLESHLATEGTLEELEGNDATKKKFAGTVSTAFMKKIHAQRRKEREALKRKRAKKGSAKPKTSNGK
jgi:hypothetical protein